MTDLTVIFYTANYIREPFGSFVREQILEAIGDARLISVSQKPMNFGENICVGDIGRSFVNIYRQILVGAEAADTHWVALAEDDILYPPGHYDYRPSNDDVAAYEMNRWAIYTWVNDPIYFAASKRYTVGMIAAREVVVEALRERFSKYPDDAGVPLSYWAEIGRYEKRLGVTARPVESFFSELPTVVFFHEDALGYQYLGERKYRPPERVRHLPYWGDAGVLLSLYNDSDPGSGGSADG